MSKLKIYLTSFQSLYQISDYTVSIISFLNIALPVVPADLEEEALNRVDLDASLVFDVISCENRPVIEGAIIQVSGFFCYGIKCLAPYVTLF